MLTGYLVLYPTRNVYTWFFFWVFRVPAFVFIFYWSALQVILGVFFLKFPNTTSIAFWDHIGGLITGFILIFFLRGERRTVAEL
jgi:membrane associated rhomboid family serine protease